jgi:Lar family restriction alleviation protein
MTAAAHGLLRCPFCASAVGTVAKDGATKDRSARHYVRCPICKARGPVFFSREKAHTAWNERRYGDVNTPQPWMMESRDGGIQVAEWAARKKAEKDSGAQP